MLLPIRKAMICRALYEVGFGMTRGVFMTNVHASAVASQRGAALHTACVAGPGIARARHTKLSVWR